jgi:hypothetical protein
MQFSGGSTNNDRSGSPGHSVIGQVWVITELCPLYTGSIELPSKLNSTAASLWGRDVDLVIFNHGQLDRERLAQV